MAGLRVTVCLPASASGDAATVEKAIAAATAPFDMNGDNPVDRTPRRRHAASQRPGVCAGGPRGLLDLAHLPPEPDLGVDTDACPASLPPDTLLVRLHCHG
ncbi:hypothetical protein [Streptacidiphilus jiangxiensis]|uniref:Uncharacterized protein n=1 Tax=Streptacidiphilus jiangxiensis TaxID=235985 RepID=A0A1H7HTR5_STRJI|nr:hypothetical protein [Streptacidiphilus jiangxiensis]SEK53037.1 hypothetical protein SAMN05414137_102330 [Streptacidiphilus jiangxiensis]